MKNILTIDWSAILLGSEEWSFLPEVALRTLIMFMIIITGLRFMGKRGVKQLSVVELVVIIGLGSAAGDPMFYKEVGIVFSLLVFLIIIALYAGLTYIVGKSKKAEDMLEGKPLCLIQDGVFVLENFKKENLGSDEFFAELRLKGISHLGQVETAIEETSGELSVFYFADEDIRPGLSVMPGSLNSPLTEIPDAGHYSCTFCAYTEEKASGSAGLCPNCKREEWVKASCKKRIT
ncbi:DUF421 domain-containing protein [Chryseobacterium sp. HSC-36S06]|uniref:DUF421 domain-containing protein n=1 Tax=Chryseobacterium sp. HSC-36S06 TaxID=2910970 RepID=UPI00209D1B23|nr:DUF421 domain-containing protein [Chryseobacterium sp. HSC-36S06]MCP2038813.1 uncharacterized membrane protein YcaP (DUF421 family) [Chryseobacterium sp. HSC-36S06]